MFLLYFKKKYSKSLHKIILEGGKKHFKQNTFVDGEHKAVIFNQNA